MNIKLGAVVVGLALVALVAMFVARGARGAEPVEPQTVEGGSVTSSMAYQGDGPVFETVRELAAASSLVIHGTVQTIGATSQMTTPGEPVAELPPAKRDAVGYPVTEVTVKAERVLAGAGVSVGELVRVVSMGEGPLAQPGTPVVLFLTRGADGLYRLSAEAQSVYPVRDGRLAPISDEVAHLPVGKALAGLTPDELAAQVK